MNTVTQLSPPIGRDHTPTPEERAADLQMEAWKAERTRQALQCFLRRNPSGRVIPKIN